MSYRYAEDVQDTITSLVSNDFDQFPYEVTDVSGTIHVTANVTISLPDGWEYTGYHASIEIERSISF